MPRPSTFSVALDLNGTGTLVDVSTYLESEEDTTRTWGKPTSFDDVSPGEFSFVLDNRDGRFSPGNTATYTNPPIEGMKVCWQTNTRLVAGSVIAVEPTFRDDESARAQVRITCNDMLANAARNQLMGGLASALVAASTPFLYWPLNDAASAIFAAEQSGNNGPVLQPDKAGRYTFGADGVPAVGETQLRITTQGVPRFFSASFDMAGRNDAIGVWITPDQTTTGAYLAGVTQAATNPTVSINPTTAKWELNAGGFPPVVGPTAVAGSPTYVAFGLNSSSTLPYSSTATLYVNGTSYGSTFSFNLGTTSLVSFGVGLSTAPDTAAFSHLSIAQNLIHEELAGPSTEAVRLAAIASTTPEIVLATLPTDLSTAPLGVSDLAGSAVLEALNGVMTTEQGYIDTVTTGTLTAPVQKIRIRARNRPTTVSYTYDNEADLSGSPQFSRDNTDTVSAVDTTSPTFEVNVTDATLVARVGSANDSLDVLYANYADVYAAGSDRINRGKNTAYKLTSIVVDALHTSTDRWANLLAMVPGDRIRITGLPSTQLGFSTWDGWLIGVTETHNTSENSFELLLDPCTPAEAVYDSGTDRYAAGGDLSLSSGITAVATSMSVATIGSKLQTAGIDLPYTLLIDKEQVTVTACSTATPQVATIARGQNGTTATTHATGANVELASPPVYAY